MTNMCQLSNNTKAYVKRYDFILEEMIGKMSSVKIADSISGSFIVQMIPHHRAAIEMSENLLRYTTNIPLQNIALNIISSQKKSIENMTAVYPECQTCTNPPEQLAFYGTKNQSILNTMFHDMHSACISNNIDATFMRQMIPHHMGAVRMSENALHYRLCSGLIPLLDEIIVSQKKGIREMHQLLHEITAC